MNQPQENITVWRTGREAKAKNAVGPAVDRDAQGFGRRIKTGVWALADQGLLTLANFMLHVLLARWLFPPAYGAFTVAFAIFLLLGALHIAMFSEPMVVYGATWYRENFSQYLSALLWGHMGFAACGSALLGLVGTALWISGFGALASPLFAFSVCAPFILFLGLMRGVYYVRLEQLARAVQGGGLYLIQLLGGIVLLWRYEFLSATAVIWVMGLASLTAGIWLALPCYREQCCWPAKEVVREVWLRHWRYGRWSLATYAFIWIPENLPYLLLPLWGGLETSAALRAVMNLLMPLLRAYAALAAFLLATFVRARNHVRFDLTVRRCLMLVLGGAIVYGALLIVFQRSLMTWLYQGRYEDEVHLVWILGLLPLCSGAMAVFGGALRALERPDRVFWAYILAALVTLTVGVGLIAGWGMMGTALGFWFSGITGAVAMAMFYGQLERRSF